MSTIISLTFDLFDLFTTGAIFSLQFTKNFLAAWLRPDPLGELERSPRPPSRNEGCLLLREGGGEGKGREGGEGKGGREGVPHAF